MLIRTRIDPSSGAIVSTRTTISASEFVGLRAQRLDTGGGGPQRADGHPVLDGLGWPILEPGAVGVTANPTADWWPNRPAT